MIQEIHHIEIIVSSEASVSFYKKLGFKEIFRKERSCDEIVLMEGNGFKLELFIDSNHPKKTNDIENIEIRHFALKVNDIEETLKELNIENKPIMNDWVGERYCYIEDPDGLPIEIHE